MILAAFVIAVVTGFIWLCLVSDGCETYVALATALGLVAGPWTLAGVAFNWDWFFEEPVSQRFVALFGRSGARVAYLVLGTFMTGLGAFLLGAQGYLERLG
jgi:hypothetical protein